MSARLLTRTGLAVLITASLWPGRASAQVDLSGQWAPIISGDAKFRGPGPDLGDQAAIPLNEEGRAFTYAYSYSTISMPERMCMHWSQDYMTFTGHQIVFQRIDDPVNGGITGWYLSAGGSDRSPMPIWMDGRPVPSANDLHTFGAFTTGHWDGGILTAEVTHMAHGITQRNGAPLSDEATMTAHFIRHGDFLTILTRTVDPIYLAEPYVMSASFRLNPVGNANPLNAPCYPLTEVPRLDVMGTVPHYLPGQNNNMEAFAKLFGLPLDAAWGGPGQQDPSYRKKLKDTWKQPGECHVRDAGRQDCIPGPRPTPKP